MLEGISAKFNSFTQTVSAAFKKLFSGRNVTHQDSTFSKESKSADDVYQQTQKNETNKKTTGWQKIDNCVWTKEVTLLGKKITLIFALNPWLYG